MIFRLISGGASDYQKMVIPSSSALQMASQRSSVASEVNPESPKRSNTSLTSKERRALETNTISPLNYLRKKKLESKAWYDCPSDDDKEVKDEADSLASLISVRGASSDDD